MAKTCESGSHKPVALRSRIHDPNIYARTAEAFAAQGVEVRHAHLAGTRNIVEVIFSYTNRNTDYTEKSFVRVDVTEEFPFLATKMSLYYDC